MAFTETQEEIPPEMVIVITEKRARAITLAIQLPLSYGANGSFFSISWNWSIFFCCFVNYILTLDFLYFFNSLTPTVAGVAALSIIISLRGFYN